MEQEIYSDEQLQLIDEEEKEKRKITEKRRN